MKHKNKYHNRELSWLQFNARVLQEAEDITVPLLERLRFLGIFSNNLDEFFRVRYAAIKRIERSKDDRNKRLLGGFSANRLLKEITQIVIKQQADSLEILHHIQEQLKQHDIHIVNENSVLPQHDEFLRNFFIQKVSPALVTIMLNDLDNIPKLKDSAAYLAVKMVLKETKKKKNSYILIELPSSVERFVVLPKVEEKQYIILLDDVIRFNLTAIFNIFEYESISAHMIKITRDAQLDLEGDFSKSYIEKILDSVKDRIDGDPVRFVYDKKIEQDTLDFLLETMGIDDADSIIPGGRYHNRRDYMKFPELGSKHLFYDKIAPLPIQGLSLQGSLLKGIAEKDFILYAPYQTFSYVVKFLREAALDPKVKTIGITIYRLAEVSHIASSLINAAKNGKKVTVSIELQARFDEANNIKYAERMQREGIHLIFGVTGLKVHAKACIIDRLEGEKVKRYGFISTGNFNENTAKIYTDYTLFTANQSLLKDIKKVFEFFEVNYRINKYKHLIVSPHYTREAFYQLIDNEINFARTGKKASLHFKMNSLSDYLVIDKLYEASQEGVEIKLIIRGICCLIPQLEGVSENIEVISIVDKFLEHPRLYIFGNNGDQKVYISSADMMTRNLDNRVEITCPIYDDDLKIQLLDTFDIAWKENVKARVIGNHDKNIYRKKIGKEVRSQFETYEYYLRKINVNI